jgi:nitroimidazol reductase NimA-like FMN-containing flavoprotein (pyridoxamine 5'-phosphate oxidase superfamily)
MPARIGYSRLAFWHIRSWSIAMSESSQPGRLSVLDTRTCLQLLRAHSVGRLAFNADPSPEVLPVNYIVDGDGIFVCTGPGAKHTAALAREPATFQVDGHDEQRGSAWSVMIRGTLDVVDKYDIEALRPQPLVGGKPEYLLCLSIYRITGRRIPPEAGWTVSSQVWRDRDASDLMG